MLALQIVDRKDFTSKLFLGEVFHHFSFVEASFTTFLTHTLDGTLQKAFYDSDSCPQRTFCLWEEVQPQCYAIIRGKRTPLQFKIVLQLAPENVERLLLQSGLPIRSDDVFSLSLNFHFDGKQILCTTGTSLRIFTLDRSLDRIWDDMVKCFLKKQGISYMESP